MSENVAEILTSGVKLTDAALERLLPGADTLPHSIHRAMRHSTFAGGKRLRPILVIESARMVAHGKLPEGIADLSSVIEMLHTYSLIHDDLPAMDNDALRRGQPTCHVAFGEAMAILAGDALQALAFEVLAADPALRADPGTHVEMLRTLAAACGSHGMAGGQALDLNAVGRHLAAEELERMHVH